MKSLNGELLHTLSMFSSVAQQLLNQCAVKSIQMM